MAVTLHDVHWTYHDVAGHSLAEVAHHIAQLEEAGLTTWAPTYHATRWHGHSIAAAQVDVRISVSMPHWGASASAPEPERAEWDRFLTALRAHEQGHIDLVTQYLEFADALIEGVSEHTAHQQWTENLHNLRLASDHYDAANDHGLNDGCVIDVP